MLRNTINNKQNALHYVFFIHYRDFFKPFTLPKPILKHNIIYDVFSL